MFYWGSVLSSRWGSWEAELGSCCYSSEETELEMSQGSGPTPVPCTTDTLDSSHPQALCTAKNNHFKRKFAFFPGVSMPMGKKKVTHKFTASQKPTHSKNLSMWHANLCWYTQSFKCHAEFKKVFISEHTIFLFGNTVVSMFDQQIHIWLATYQRAFSNSLLP